MKSIALYSCVAAISLMMSCESKTKEATLITVKNSLELPRQFETVEISKSAIHLNEGERFENLVIRDKATQTIVPSQFVDEDQDGTADVLLFQPKVDSKSEKQYELVVEEGQTKQEDTAYCYSRFVPERTDDYAWENNKVAFRTYGPVAQKMVEDSVAGGTLSSGIDAWLKKVEYPIINKWYAANDKDPGFYHIDHGEGLDNFHVGSSRGVGGTAVKVDTSYYISKNFTDYKTITTGPIRTSFVLEYADWDANGNKITETKHISLDYGSNFSKFEIEVTGTDVLSVGLTLHDKKGEITEQVQNGWISYWESQYFDSELGTAIVAANKADMVASDYYLTSMPDRSNLYTQLKVHNNKAVYYAGFAWKESGQYSTKAAWEKHLNTFSKKVNTPLEVSIQ
ncbi:DUF4861 domain-containing protein [Formosa haliotis]|uniref:DUF4861 domain-containing protein n=1 Tax=Formosa haliotis TaxID=1555194 RepID=UPI00082670FA|nr:DUF4861 domain-containing protein [Formosa haliotis]